MYRQGLAASAGDWDDPQTLPDLLKIQEKSKGDEFDLDAKN